MAVASIAGIPVGVIIVPADRRERAAQIFFWLVLAIPVLGFFYDLAFGKLDATSYFDLIGAAMGGVFCRHFLKQKAKKTTAPAIYLALHPDKASPPSSPPAAASRRDPEPPEEPVELAGKRRGEAGQRQAAFGRADDALAPQAVFDRHRVGLAEEQRHQALDAATTARGRRDGRLPPCARRRRRRSRWRDAPPRGCRRRRPAPAACRTTHPRRSSPRSPAAGAAADRSTGGDRPRNP